MMKLSLTDHRDSSIH